MSKLNRILIIPFELFGFYAQKFSVETSFKFSSLSSYNCLFCSTIHNWQALIADRSIKASEKINPHFAFSLRFLPISRYRWRRKQKNQQVELSERRATERLWTHRANIQGCAADINTAVALHRASQWSGDSIEGKKLSNYRISRHRPCGSRLVLMKTLPVSVSLCDAFYIADCNAIRLARSSPDFIYIVGNFIIALVTNERLIEPMYRSFRKITEW